ncbi:Tetraspanin family-domain-containing protein [Mycotypha africana]|uniref:Tetraspanin family-domain-containing protein n=1 Tax=Mycotypha africana TaxID=64632 RepID=UPI0023014737|nr:Tetraspanin family-domain-containing protein [Mycotypha africana]KAI8984023.1 Tetraspanin family-domain-containing protein [Mycotypha africana]
MTERSRRGSRGDSGRIPLLLNNTTQDKKSEGINELMTLFHAAFMLIGLGIISIGAYVMNTNSLTVSTMLFVTGSIITITSFLGCFGSYMELTSFLNIYNSITAIALVMELITFGLIYTHKAKIELYGSLLWDFFRQQDTQFIFEIEQTFNCCGYDSTTDRSIPDKACSIALNTDIACKQSIRSNIQNWYPWIIIFVAVESIALLVSVLLTYLVQREQKEEKAYLSFLLPSTVVPSPVIISPSGNHSSSNHYYPPPLYQQHEGSSTMNNSYNGYRRLSNLQKKPSAPSADIPRYGSTPSTYFNAPRVCLV